MELEQAKRGVGGGWSKLIEELYERKPEGCIITHVKEKYGGLRIEAVGETTEEFWSLERELEEKSEHICEFCGDPGEIRDMPWILTLCQDCYETKMDKKLSTD